LRFRYRLATIPVCTSQIHIWLLFMPRIYCRRKCRIVMVAIVCLKKGGPRKGPPIRYSATVARTRSLSRQSRFYFCGMDATVPFVPLASMLLLP
jgi:hypothetical protein